MIAVYKHLHYHVAVNSNALPLDNRGTPGADPGFQERRFTYIYIYIITETDLFHFHRIFKTGGGEGFERTP